MHAPRRPSNHPASQSTRSQHSSLRNRSAQDPFADQVYSPPYQTSTRVDNPRSAPLPSSKPTYRQHQLRRSTDTRERDPRMLEAAVRDAVTVRPSDQSSRPKMPRSQTTGVQTSASGSRTSPASSRRSYSQDSVTQNPPAVEKVRRNGKSKKGSTHADVIDRLDFTGVGPMFHHDGPFDACMPSRNKHKSKAPMFAWSAPHDEREDPSSAAHFRAATSERRPTVADSFGGHYDSPYAVASQMGSDFGYHQAPKKQVDRIAEAWGIHEPEPYEEFFGGGGYPNPNGDSGHASAASSIRGIDNQRNRRNTREQFGDHNGDGRIQPKRAIKSNIPPPQPIFIAESVSAPGNSGDVSSSLPSPGIGSPGTPKRSKSLMQKFRKMRDAPNIPANYADGADDGSPPSSLENYSVQPTQTNEGRPGRPAHRHQNSFFGRFGRNQSGSRGQAAQGEISPTLEAPEQYTQTATNRNRNSSSNKALPPRPLDFTSPDVERDVYFETPVSPGGTPMSPSGSGLNRKTSLLKKVKGVVRNAGK